MSESPAGPGGVRPLTPSVAPSASDSITESVGVVVRVRPLSTKERADPSVHNCIQALPDTVVIDGNAHKRPASVDGKDVAYTANSPFAGVTGGSTSGGGAATVTPASQPIRSSTRPYQFSVDHVFHTHASQIEVYEESCKRIVEGVFHGINGSILAYGATGSGKTHTMFGSTMSAAGIVYQAVQDIFAEKERLEEEEGKRVRIRCSFLEVYNEEVFDLLVKSDGSSGSSSGNASSSGPKANKRVPLQVRETALSGGETRGSSSSNNNINSSSGGGGLYIPGLTHIFPETLDDFTQGVEHGHAQRFVAATGANAQSSRSHAIITVEVEVRDDPARATASPFTVAAAAATDDDDATTATASASASVSNNTSTFTTDFSPASTSNGTGKRKKQPASPTVTVASIQFGDLAGSERAASTSNTGLRLREGGSINRSLLALGAVVQSLALQKVKRRQTGGKGGNKIFIPYRGSKLTRLLRDGIGGNCRTMMLFCVSPSTKHIEETVNTMKFAMNAREIQVVAHHNVFAVNSSQLAKTQETVIEELRAELARTRAALAQYTGEESTTTEVQEVNHNDATTTATATSTKTVVAQDDSSAAFAPQLSSVSIESPTVANASSVSGSGSGDDGTSHFGALTTTATVTAVTAVAAVPPRPGTPGAAAASSSSRGTLTPSASTAKPAVSPLSASQVEVSASNSMPRPSLSSRAARPSVFADNSRLFSELEAKLKDFSAQKESLYHEVRDAEEQQRDGEAQLRDLQWRLATFLISDATGSRARGEEEGSGHNGGSGRNHNGGGTGAAADTVGVAGLRKTIARMEAAQAQQSSQLAELTTRLEDADRQFDATRTALLRERQGTALELLLDNARLRQGCTEAECLAAHYHQECRSLLNGEGEYAEALSKCVGALQQMRPLLLQLLQHNGSVNRIDSGSVAAALEVADVALLFALLPTASTEQRMQTFETALRGTITAQQQQQQQQQQQLEPIAPEMEQEGQASPSPSFVHPPLAPSPTNRSGSGSGSRSPTPGGRSGSTPQSNQLAEQYRDLVATAESMHLHGSNSSDGTYGLEEDNNNNNGSSSNSNGNGGAAGGVRTRHGHGSAPSRAFGRTVSLTGLTALKPTTTTTATTAAAAAAATTTGATPNGKRKKKTTTPTPSPFKQNKGPTATTPTKRTRPGAAPAAGSRSLQRSVSTPLPFSRSASARATPGKKAKAAAAPKPSITAGVEASGGHDGSPSHVVRENNNDATNATAATPERRPNKGGKSPSTSPGHALSPKAMWSVTGANGTNKRTHNDAAAAAAFTRTNTTRSFGSPHKSQRGLTNWSTPPAKTAPRASAEDTPHRTRSVGSGSSSSVARSSDRTKGKTPLAAGKKRVVGAGTASGYNAGFAARRNSIPVQPTLPLRQQRQQQQRRVRDRRGSAIGAESNHRGVLARRLTRSQTAVAARGNATTATTTTRAHAPTSSEQRYGHLENTATTLSPLLSSCSSLGGDVDDAGRLRGFRDGRENSTAKEKRLAAGGNGGSMGSSLDSGPYHDHHSQNEQSKLTVARLLERSATMPALPQYGVRSPLGPQDGGAAALHGSKEDQQRYAMPRRPRSSLPDDLTVSRSTLFSDSPLNSRDLAGSGSCCQTTST